MAPAAGAARLKQLEWREIIPAVGAEVTSHSAKEIAALATSLARTGGAIKEEAQPILNQVAEAVRKRGVVVLRAGTAGSGADPPPGDGGGGGAGSQLLHPAEIGAIYRAVQEASGLRVLENPGGRMAASNIMDPSKSIVRSSFPGFPETQALGHAPEPIADWFGLSGKLIAGDTWYTRGDGSNYWFGTWHHDGGHSGVSTPNPAFVSMYCQEAPKRGGGTVTFAPGSAPLAYPAGATLFCSMKLPLKLAPASLLRRARSMVSVYTRGQGKAVEGVYPVMGQSRVAPTTPSAEKLDAAGQPFPGSQEATGAFRPEDEDPDKRPSPKTHPKRLDEYFKMREALERDDPGALAALKALYSVDPVSGEREMREALVQTDPASGDEYVLMSTQCLHHLEEPGRGALGWAESMQFLEDLLGPAARAPHVFALDWRPGDYAIWDNRTTCHLTTGSYGNQETGEPGYAAIPGERRLMTRTEMQSTWVPDRYPPGLLQKQNNTTEDQKPAPSSSKL